MTRKDYVVIADAFALTRPVDRGVLPQSSDKPERILRNQWLVDREYVANAFADDNPAFDRLRFYEATEA